MAQGSHMTKYNLAVLAAGIAAVCGLYIVYSVWATRPVKGALRRSNAVHRPRERDRGQLTITVTPADANAPLGQLQLGRGGRVFAINVAVQLFSRPELQEAVGQISDSDMHAAEIAAVHSILYGCSAARDPTQRHRISNLGLDGLPEALSAGNEDEIRRLSAKIAAVLWNIDKSTIDQAVEQFLHGGGYAANELSGSEGTIVDFAATEDFEGVNGAPREPSQGLKGLLYYIAEEDTRRKAYEHRGIHCEECGETPIRGVRWHCLNCPDFDLCSTCEAQTSHIKTHVFVKIRIPLPLLSQPTKAHPLWYPGDMRKTHPALDASARKRIAQETGFEEPKIDAFYDQFTCIANVPWPSDSLKVKAAIDRRAFNKALTSERWTNRFAPNAIHDRMFAFYDTNHDDRIGFEEFVSGLAYLRGPKRFASLHRALKGFDIDDDGLVARKDFVRLFRAKYAIQTQIVDDMVEAHEDEQTYAAMDVLRSSQPISSVFNLEEIPPGEETLSTGKRQTQFGDMEPMQGTKTILDDGDVLPIPQELKSHPAAHSSSPGGLSRRDHALRLEEMLYGTPSEPSGQPPAANHVSEQVDASRTGSTLFSEREEDARSIGNESSNFSDTAEWGTLREAVEDGFDQMLNPLFEAKETEGDEILATVDERRRWREQIDNAVAEKRAFQEELKSAAMIDPLMATAMESLTTVQVQRKSDQASEPAFRGEIVPTDSESLAQREADIAKQPLEELLAATGYSTIDMEELGSKHESASSSETDTPTASTTSQHTESGPEIVAESARYTAPLDPTWPQLRPNSMPQWAAGTTTSGEDQSKTAADMQMSAGGMATTSSASPQEPPSRHRLEYLALLDDAEKETRRRGGPGRLTFDEIEAMVQADSSRELRGLVISWLDWASF